MKKQGHTVRQVNSDSGGYFAFAQETALIRRNDAEELVLHFSGAADALEHRHGHDQGVRENAILGEFELGLSHVTGNVEAGDVRVAIGCRCADR